MNLYEEITMKVIHAMKCGVMPWCRPYGEKRVGSAPLLTLPRNAKTGKAYKGINVMLLMMGGYPSPYWATEKTWSEMGGVVKEGETGTDIIFTKHYAALYSTTRRYFVRSYKVYNFRQVDGCGWLTEDAPYELDYRPAESLLTNAGIVFRESHRAYYSAWEDVVFLPSQDCFKSLPGYYSTKLHEAIHWTGNKRRLNRKIVGEPDSEEYAEEEIVAELGSAFLAAHLNIPACVDEIPNHASYIKSWLARLERGDNLAIFKASAAAQKAVTYLLKFERVSL
jgi:antirestriction protein ArdC